jgi:hypothetical protein
MTERQPRSTWSAPRWTTSVDEAALAYRRGVTDLVAGVGRAAGLLGRAVELDPDFLLAHVALTVAAADGDRGSQRPWPLTTVTRGERQHAEVVEAALAAGVPAGSGRALWLRREHLAEYPGDVLIVALPLLVPVWQPR